MKVKRGHIPLDDEAVHVWHTYHAPAKVGISAGAMFTMLTQEEARDFAEAVLEAVAKAEKVEKEVTSWPQQSFCTQP